MRTRRVAIVALLILALVGAMAAAGVARDGSGSTRFEVLVWANPETEMYYDWGWTLNEEVTTADGEHLGWSLGPCMNTSPDPDVTDRYWCDLGMRLPDGDIIFGGPIDIDEWLVGETVFAVQGGTERFRGITGEVRLIPSEDFSHSVLVFRVRNARASY